MRILPEELTEKIDLYKQWLFKGDQIKIAKDLKQTETFVSMVMRKKAFNKEVVERAREIAISNARGMGIEIN
jgi:hypothetical protein